MQRAIPTLGAHAHPGPTTRFSLYASDVKRCAVRLYSDASTPLRTVPLHALAPGYYELLLENVGHGALYRFVLDDRELPDPYAHFLPHGVHGPAMVVEPHYAFRHPRPPRPERPIIYEMHVGTFTEHGTYAAAVLRLPELAQLGVTTLELMPVAAFPGGRGWGYDGVAPFAPFAAYGTPDELRALIDAAHGLGLGVLLDVVYNHFGPAGNYLGAYSPGYFTRDIPNLWGDGPNYGFMPMRELVRENVRYWLEDFRCDGLRLDAVHAIFDPSEKHILRDVVEVARHVLPSALLIAEDDRNEPGLVKDFGFDAIWADDFHHQLHVTLTHERDGYYAAYHPGLADLSRSIERGWLYEGHIMPSTRKPRGKPANELLAPAFVYCLQNHDQVGNRALGDRLSQAVSLDAYCLASSLLLFLPMTPLLFMGQEWAASSPFQFFTDHEPELGEAVVRGRREEFKSFQAFSDPAARASIPDPQAAETFERSKLRWEERDEPRHREVLALYRRLLALRREDPVLSRADRAQSSVQVRGNLLEVRCRGERQERVWLGNFGRAAVRAEVPADAHVLAGTLDARGELRPETFIIYAHAL